jgi:hypothetical protein
MASKELDGRLKGARITVDGVNPSMSTSEVSYRASERRTI